MIPASISDTFVEKLRNSNNREIGGVLFAEQLAYGEFSLLETTFHTSDGNTFTFDRDIVKARKDIRRFHSYYNGKPQKFNYFGEWHSHPHSTSEPSEVDNSMMWEILSQTDESVNFLVLIIVKLIRQSSLDLNATAFLRSGHKLNCTTIIAPTTKGNSNDRS